MNITRLTLLASLLALTLAGPTQAQERHREGGHMARPERGGLVLDQRFHHDHYYPPRGHVSAVVPSASINVGYGGIDYRFHAGVWWRPHGGRFIVVAPPIGIYLPLLPPAYVTLWIGGSPYYYANGAYYMAAPGRGYVVVAPPPEPVAAPGSPPPPPPPMVPTPKAPPEPIIYPRNGQSSTQTEADRQECNRWATTVPSAVADAEVFQRAVAACMDGRGYTVR